MERCDTQLKEKFHQFGLEAFYKTYLDKDKYAEFYKFALSMVSLLGNTYAREQLFSPTKHIKPQVRTRITDVHLKNWV